MKGVCIRDSWRITNCGVDRRRMFKERCSLPGLNNRLLESLNCFMPNVPAIYQCPDGIQMYLIVRRFAVTYEGFSVGAGLVF